MSRAVLLAFVLLMGFHSTIKAEEVLIRLQLAELSRDVLRKAKEGTTSPIVDAALLEKVGVEPEVVEVRAKVGEAFYCKAKIGKRSITLRGKVKSEVNEPALILEFNMAKTTFTDEIIPIVHEGRQEVPTTLRIESRIALERGETFLVDGMIRSTRSVDVENRERREESCEVVLVSLAEVPAEE